MRTSFKIFFVSFCFKIKINLYFDSVERFKVPEGKSKKNIIFFYLTRNRIQSGARVVELIYLFIYDFSVLLYIKFF